MNLFVIAWNLPSHMPPLVMSELENMQDVFPMLDPTTQWSFGSGKPLFAASMHNPRQAALPRVYTARTEKAVTLYDGCMVASDGSFAAWDASALASNWPVLSARLEGQYVAVRVTTEPHRIEIINDFLGFYQAYWSEHNGTWLMSNSVELLSRITDNKTIDPVGAAHFLGTGWVGENRTLRQGIRVIPPAQKWTWEENRDRPRKTTYFDRVQLTRGKAGRLRRAHVEQLSNDLAAICRELAKGFGPLVCPLTAGRDSRVLAAFLTSGKIPSQYFSMGFPGSIDVKIAKEIARQFELPHQLIDQGEKNLLNAWQYHGRNYILQTDGMASLATLSHDQMSNPEDLGTRLYGIGGEIARGFYYDKDSPHLLLTGRKFESGLSHRKALSHLQNRKKLLREEAVENTKRYVDQFLLKAAGEGFSAIDQLDLFYTYERVRRWAGSSLRSFKSEQDKFCLLLTRPFVQAAFSVSPIYRYQEFLLHMLLSVLHPELLAVPFEKEWHPQQPLATIGRYWARKMGGKILRATGSAGSKDSKLDATSRDSYGSKLTPRSFFFETMLGEIRHLCLDQPSSPLWSMIDRSEFESITSAATAPLERYGHIGLLLDIVTLFQWVEASRVSRVQKGI